MRDNFLRLYVHFVWGTWDRLPLIESDYERDLHRVIGDQATHTGCKVLALNGTADHIHLLARIPATITIAELMKQAKGVSSHFVNERRRTDHAFKWQGSYGALSVSRWDVKKVASYVHNQKQHHANAKLIGELELMQAFDDEIRGV